MKCNYYTLYQKWPTVSLKINETEDINVKLYFIAKFWLVFHITKNDLRFMYWGMMTVEMYKILLFRMFFLYLPLEYGATFSKYVTVLYDMQR